MKCRICLTVLLAVLILGSVPVLGQQGRGRRGIYGDWVVKQEFNGRTFESILSFSRDQEGNLTGSFIRFMGVSELKDVKFEDGKLSFSFTRRNRNGETSTSTFTGTIAGDELTGTMKGGTREYELKGKRSPRIPRAVGKWQMTYSMGQREITSTLIIKADAKGKLTAQWPSERVEHTITDLTYARGELKFKRTTKVQDRQFESTFAGTIRGNDITGTFTSQRGETPVKGTRIGADAIGTWNLEVTSDRGTRKQRLRVNPDMSGLYGAIPVKEVALDGNKLSFKVTLEFGDRSFEMNFAGTLAEGKLTGKLTTSQGTREVAGSKVMRRFRRRN